MSHVISSKALPKHQRGVGLIEVLITVLVLAIGLLGLSALQLASLKNNQSAMLRSLVVVYSYTMVEAIYADKDSARKGLFNISLTAKPGSNSFPATVHKIWRDELSRNLGATGSVNCSTTQCTIIVQWDDSRGGQGSSTEQLTTEVWL